MIKNKNFEFGGSVFINEKDDNNKWFLFQKFGYCVYIVDDDINCIRTISNSNLIRLSLKRKVQWYEVPYYSRPNLRMFKKMIGVIN